MTSLSLITSQHGDDRIPIKQLQVSLRFHPHQKNDRDAVSHSTCMCICVCYSKILLSFYSVLLYIISVILVSSLTSSMASECPQSKTQNNPNTIFFTEFTNRLNCSQPSSSQQFSSKQNKLQTERNVSDLSSKVINTVKTHPLVIT